MENISQKIFSQTMELWVLPEIEKRKKANRLPSDFILTKAQVIFSQGRKDNKVRLNSEIKAIAKVKINRDVKKGEKLYEHDIGQVKNIELTNKDPNAGHITLLLFKKNWIISFDFRYNKRKVQDYLDAAKEFYEVSKYSLKNQMLRPFFENAFTCNELLTQALLIQFFDRNSLKDHKSRINKITNWAELGNIDEKFSKQLKRLWKLRSSARYLSSTEFKKEDADEHLNSLKELYDYVEKSIN